MRTAPCRVFIRPDLSVLFAPQGAPATEVQLTREQAAELVQQLLAGLLAGDKHDDHYRKETDER